MPTNEQDHTIMTVREADMLLGLNMIVAKSRSLDEPQLWAEVPRTTVIG